MILKKVLIEDSLNKGLRKQSLNRKSIELFKGQLKLLFSQIDEKQDEEYHKNLISGFLHTVYYHDNYLINVNKKQDLVVRLGNTPKDNVGVILEFKKPNEKREMISFEHPNSKAFQQLILYYLRERIENQNHTIKNLIITNFNEWYIFDEVWFEKNIYRNTKLIKEYEEYKLSGHDTKHFYNEIAAKHIDSIDGELSCTYFNLKDYQPFLNRQGFGNLDGLAVDDTKLINLYKILSPEHLLKLPFANDSNSLNKEFYEELLYILGLTEVKTGTKRTIEKNATLRNEGFLIENTSQILITRNKLKNITDLSQYGESETEQCFSISLELCITWLNRILFLKLLEGQLIKYHKGNRNYAFLNADKIKDYDELDELFFDVLANPIQKRTQTVREKYGDLPYLNSSLFDISDLEDSTIRIADLKDRFEIPMISSTVLKGKDEKRKYGKMNTLQYLFEFLNSYNFASDDTAEIQEENKTIISASVLGLIFEKLNGYKDGSFFTPGYITMYMCRETIRRAIVQKFTDSNLHGFENLEGFSDLKDKLDYSNKEVRERANAIINSIKICDPAVGSGHFLVSALNEMIAIKSELKVLSYTDGTRVRNYEITVENDELIIIDQETKELFSYHVSEKHTAIAEIQQLQETLFIEKRTIIENCLFGVDLNPKSAMICRLRLWIELLKNAFYTIKSNYVELETLPNIDINIKVGNSLVSFFDFNSEGLKNGQLTKIQKFTKEYKVQVENYKNAKHKEAKQEFFNHILTLKNEFMQFANPKDKDYIELQTKESELTTQFIFFSKDEQEQWKLKHIRLQKEVEILKQKYEERKKSIYKNAFEWRFEFPEILDENGKFKGFDIIIGNPPYGVNLSTHFKEHFKTIYENVHLRTPDTYNYFTSQALNLTKPEGYISFIVPNNILFQNENAKTRQVLLRNTIESIINLGDGIFNTATVPTCMFLVCKTPDMKYVVNYSDLRKEKEMEVLRNIQFQSIPKETILQTPSFLIGINNADNILIDKIQKKSITVSDIAFEVASGISTGADQVFRISKEFSEENHFENKLLKKVLSGRDISKYAINYKDNYLIYTQKKIEISEYPNIYQYLQKHEEQLSKKRETVNGTLPYWCLHWHRYPELFEKPKIIMRQTADKIVATYDDNGYYSLNSTLVLQLNDEYIDWYKFVLAVLNSKITNFVYKAYTQEEGRVFAEVKPKNIRKLFIPKTDKKTRNKISQLVDKILEKISEMNDNEISKIENMIDEILFKIYDLSNEEIAKIAEG